jgi:hypothetical protein
VSSGRALAACGALAAVLGAPAGARAESSTLARPLGGATVDWRAGVVIARAGAAADLRLPGPENARPAAERQARKRAADILRAALPGLPLGGGRKPAPDKIEAAIGRAKAEVEYQSNGGVLLALVVPFADLTGAAPPAGDKKTDTEVAIAAASAPLLAAPPLLVGQRRVAVRAARYELGEPPAAVKALAARSDKEGALVLRKEPDGQALSEARVVIYVKSIVEPGR